MKTHPGSLPLFLLCLVLCAGILLPALVPGAEAAGNSSVSIVMDGSPINMQLPALLIDSSTYVPLAQFSRTLGADGVTRRGDTVVVGAPGLTVQATAGSPYIIANGRYLYAPTLCRSINGEIYAPIRPLAKAFGTAPAWIESSATVFLLRKRGPIAPAEAFYSETDIYWMSRIISAEARGECLDGKIAVGQVVMNRVNSPWHPNTVHDVIFDRRSSIQFTPAYSGAINRTPDEECVTAAKLALDGAKVVGSSLYFNMTGTSSWASRNRPYVTTIGAHNFYA